MNPTNKRGTKAEYTELRKFLIKDEYLLLQSEVFILICERANVNNFQQANNSKRRMRITNNRNGNTQQITLNYISKIEEYLSFLEDTFASEVVAFYSVSETSKKLNARK